MDNVAEVGTKNSTFPRACTKCGLEKERSDFSTYPMNGIRYFRSWCQDCMRELGRKRVRLPYAQKSEREKQGHRKASAKARSEWRKRGLCATVGCETKPITGIYCNDCRIKKALQGKTSREITKRQTLTYYGNGVMKCSCECDCATSEVEFLTIDHIKGRKVHGHKAGFGGQELYRWLRKNNWPDGFRTLCMNCNFSHGHFGYCPRTKKSEQLSGDAIAQPKESVTYSVN